MAELLQAVTARMPVRLYERLRRRAFVDRRSQADIVTAAVERYLDDLDKHIIEASR